MAVSLLAELKLRDKHTQRICVQVEHDLSSLIDGIKELNVNVSQILSELVERERERERERGACAPGEEDEDSDEGSDEDESSKCERQRPAKRLKP